MRRSLLCLMSVFCLVGAMASASETAEFPRAAPLTSIWAREPGLIEPEVRAEPQGIEKEAVLTADLQHYDTLYWHDYSVSQHAHGGPTSGDAWLFGLGVKLTPAEYPAVIVGLSHRTYQDPRSPSGGLMQIRIVDDDGADGSPGTILTKVNTQADTWDWAFHYDPLPYPYDTLWEGSFYLFMLSRDSGRVSYTLLWPYDLALNHLDKHWWHQSGAYHVCTNIHGDLSMGVVVEYGGVGMADPSEPGPLPKSFVLRAGTPNPFNSSTRIEYGLSRKCRVSMQIHDAAGNLIRTLKSGVEDAGFHDAVWDGRDGRGREVAGGLYFCCVQTDGFAGTRRLVKLK